MTRERKPMTHARAVALALTTAIGALALVVAATLAVLLARGCRPSMVSAHWVMVACRQQDAQGVSLLNYGFVPDPAWLWSIAAGFVAIAVMAYLTFSRPLRIQR